MNEYLILAQDPNAYPPEAFAGVVTTGDIDGVPVLDIVHTDDPTLAGDTLIGAWAPSGQAVAPLERALWDRIRPLGNEPSRDIYDESGDVVGQTRGGNATRSLLYHYFDGWGQRELGDHNAEDLVARLYPADDQPFVIEMRHKLFEGESNPSWDGYGWRAEILGGASIRDPGVHAIGIYSDPECTQYLYTTGAFTQQPSEWQFDGDGNPLTVWATEYNPAYQTGVGNPEPVDHHHAVLEGSAQRGYSTLYATETVAAHLYWERTQGAAGSEWTGSGVTVTSIVGAGVLGVTDSTVFQPAEFLRIKDTETEFVREHSSGVIIIDPHVADCVGEEIEWQR